MISEVKMSMPMEQTAPDRPPAWTGGWPQTAREFERLVETFQDRLVRFAFRRLGDRADAEDVAQEVLVRAYASRERRRQVLSVSAYLYRMAGNLCTDWLRRRAASRIVALDEPRILEIPTGEPDGAQLATAAEEARRIQQLLGRIPERQAEVVRLAVLDELSAREIAEIIGCPEPTVKSRLRYGLDKLREIIQMDKESLR